MVILGHPFAYLAPGEAKILPQADARQGRHVAYLSPLARLFKHPRFGDFQTLGEFGRSKEFVVIDCVHRFFPNADWFAGRAIGSCPPPYRLARRGATGGGVVRGTGKGPEKWIRLENLDDL
jgi:hypothetical protein